MTSKPEGNSASVSASRGLFLEECSSFALGETLHKIQCKSLHLNDLHLLKYTLKAAHILAAFFLSPLNNPIFTLRFTPRAIGLTVHKTQDKIFLLSWANGTPRFVSFEMGGDL